MTRPSSFHLPRLRQRGNTLTGLIIGLIVGLGIAVAVALTITKGASPFTEKTAKAGRPADPAPGEALDPNKPMYPNREAARQANKEVTQKAAARTPKPADADPLGQAIAGMTDAKPESKADSKPDSKSDSKSEARAESHPRAVALTAPAVAPAPAVTAPAAASSAAGSPAGDYIYYLQAGAFREMSDAEATRAKLALLGFEAAISDRTSDSGVLHRVRIGPYNQVESMNKARAKLLDSGVDVAIVRNQR
jgi:cell division protein FtsN